MNYGLILLGAVTLAGCARFEPRPVAPEETADRFAGRTLESVELRGFLEDNLKRGFARWPAPSWDLEMLTLAAIYYHPDLDVARAEWEVAESRRITAGERPNPTVGVAPAYNTTSAILSPWLVTATLDIPIETAGKRGYRIAQATQLAEAARLDIASAAWEVRSRVRRALLDVYAARETQTLLENEETIQVRIVRLVELQHEAGAISSFELARARLAADTTRLAVRDAERQHAEARVRLSEAIGVPVSALDAVELSFDRLSRLSGDVPGAEVRRQALLHRTDLLSALAEYAASQSALQLEIARQYPDIHLGPGYEFDQGDDKWSLGLSVTLPVFHRNEGSIAEAEARRAEAAARFNARQARVLAEIDLAVAGYRAASRKQADAETLLADLTEQERRARAIFDAGEISRSELAGLQLQLSASTLARLEAFVKVQEAAGRLEDALQSPLEWSESLWQSAPRISASEGGNGGL